MPDFQPAPTTTVISPRINPEDIFKQIGRIEGTMRKDLEPSRMAQLLSADKRRQAQVIAQARTSAIEARKELIDGLRQTIVVYVDAHVGDLKVRAHNHVIETFEEMLRSLQRSNESTITSFMETYSATVDRIGAIKNLTDEQKEEQCRLAMGRALRAQERGDATFWAILDNLREQVVRIVAEIGSQD